MLRELQESAPTASIHDLKQIVSFCYSILTSQSALPDFPAGSLKYLAKLIENNPEMPVFNALYRIYPYKLFLPSDSYQAILTLFSSLDISVPPSNGVISQKIIDIQSIDEFNSKGKFYL